MNAAQSNTLTSLSADLASAVETAARSVVYVDAHPRRDASGIVWDEHHVVTVAHAIEREDEIELLLPDGGKAVATLVGGDPSTDVALLRTNATLVPAAHSTRADLAVGHLVLAVGRDEDGATGASFGVISALDGPWRTWRGGDVERFIRPDVNVYPSFSGGPLVDAAAEVIGMNTWGLSRRMALTLPLATLERVVAALLGGGRVMRGYLGVAMQAVHLPESLRAAHALQQRDGVIVIDVAAGGPAERGGMLIGDVLLALGGGAVEDSDDVQRALGTQSMGASLPVRVLRGGEPRTLTVTIGERPHDVP